LKRYHTVALAHPSDHGLGGPGGMCALTFLKGVVNSAFPPNADAGFISRISVLALVYATLREVPPQQLEATFTHFHVGVLDGARKGQAVIVFHAPGRCALPSAADMVAVKAAVEAAQLSGSFDPLVAMAANSFVEDMGELVPATAPGLAFDRILLSVICQLGASRSYGRPPPSGAARKLRGRGKGRGKGK